MRRLYMVMALALACMAAQAHGQVQVIEEVRFSSNSTEDETRKLIFGFSPEYSDSADLAKGEQIYPPFFPPDGFFAYLALPDRLGSEDFLLSDIRGVPDSVKSGVKNEFSLRYTIRLKRGIGQQITVSFPFRLRGGIDSINVSSPQGGGSVLNHTIMRQGGQVTIHDLITTVVLTVYFNYDRAASAPLDYRGESREVAIVPNLVHPGQVLEIMGELPAGAGLSATDIYGSTVWEENLREAGTGRRFTVPALPAGVYMMRLMGSEGEILRHGRFVVVR